jgi:uncharacterized protein (TIGR03435 family)
MRTLTSLLLLTWVAFPQPQAKLEFEVASVKPSPARATGIGCKGGPGSDDPGRLTCQQMAIVVLINMAYGVKFVQVIGPDWLSGPRFDIIATLPQGTTKEQVPAMWQNLLIDRFGFRAHHESREATHFELGVAKNGPILKPAAKEGTGFVVHKQDGTHMTFPNMTMEALAGFLEGQLRKVVTDVTGLKGEYEIALAWTPDTAVPAEGAVYPALPQALQEQLGLRLETKKGPMDMLVIDQINRTPTDN